MLQSTKLAAIGQLAAGIAHEIRTPLGIIRSHSYYLKRSDSRDEQIESMGIIEESVDKANKIIDNLLNFSRLTDNTISIHNIKNLISNILELNNKAFKNKKISTKLLCPDNLKFPINGESLKHIIINLINNSSDAMPTGGLIEIIVNLNEKDLEISVSDTGTGMDEYTLENIFNPFFTTKPSGKGTGLGLYITYNEVQKMDGILKVESTLGKGSTFTITLPNPDLVNNEEV
jgi:polar amino acid transport system substrate-binding protein